MSRLLHASSPRIVRRQEAFSPFNRLLKASFSLALCKDVDSHARGESATVLSTYAECNRKMSFNCQIADVTENQQSGAAVMKPFIKSLTQCLIYFC